ncbi:nitroreductase [Clostridium polyendosporum]|uniref:Nitroreductase n=1 Tax=Clostridium polyendosporum TaxID=69208 RepID=A0A919RY39_9CLOT|nr:nitroreductase family protein [Clostridium polyendosporum]GIM27580.1 nitroreductase [Clostridium polyendosporum]
MEIINKRRSIRAYKDIQVEKEKIEKLLRAAMQAPSAFNQQAWEFIVVEDKETLKKISEMSPYSKPVENSPLTFIVLGNRDNMKVPECWQQDLGAATENLLLEAVELGLGGVWMAIAPIEERMNYIKDMFNLPENIVPYSVIPVGYPVDKPNFIDRYDSNKVHHEKW